MEKKKLKVIENKALTKDVFEMRLQSENKIDAKPGQFVNLSIDGLYLRRPISICDVNDNALTIIYKVVGVGTEKMSKMVDEEVDTLLPLGNGYDLSTSEDKPLLIGGGVGVPPMYYLAKKLIEAGKKVTVILGFNTSSEIFYEEEFKALGAKVIVTTVNGSYGIKGFVTNAIPEDYTEIYTCGPEPMLKAIYKACNKKGQYSFEERMGCGFGACMGCSCKTITGYKRICKDGPVLRGEEILWED